VPNQFVRRKKNGKRRKRTKERRTEGYLRSPPPWLWPPLQVRMEGYT
jgi:hypothetical protein